MTTGPRHAIDALLRSCGLAAVRVRPVAQVCCEIHRIALAQGGDVALRIYPAARTDVRAIDSEIAWLRALAGVGLHVPRPIPDADGRFLHAWQPDPAQPLRHAVLLAWLGGRMHDRGLTPERLRRVGVLAARMHRVAARLVADGAITTDRLAYDCDLLAWRGAARSRLLGPEAAEPARAAASRLREELAGLSTREGHGFVHGDLHPWNLLFARDAAGAIDFSDCGRGHHALDLAAPLQFLRHRLVDHHDHRAQAPRLQEALLRGYASVAPLPRDIERQLDTWIVARMFMSLDWLLDEWPAPDYRPWRARMIAGCARAFRAYADA